MRAVRRSSLKPNKHPSWSSRRTNLTAAVVPIGEGKNFSPMPHVRTTMGNKWMPFGDIVKSTSDKETILSKAVVNDLFKNVGLDVTEFANLGQHKEFGFRNLYIGVGTDLGSVLLLTTCRRWLLETKEPIKLQPLMVKLNFIKGHSAVENVVLEYLRTRSISVRIISPSSYDFAQIESAFPERTIVWESLTTESEEVKLLIKWILYSSTKTQERHPFGGSILLGTNLDSQLQKIAKFMSPYDRELNRCRYPHELWDMSMEPATPQLPLIDTCNADWKIGLIKFHKPLVTLKSEILVETAIRNGMKGLVTLLSKPPPVSSRLQNNQIRMMLDVVTDCHIRIRGARKIACDFIKKSCRLDYRLGWCTISTKDISTLPEEALRIVVSAVVAFCSNKSDVDWLKTPPDSVIKVIDYLTHKCKLPPKPIVAIPGTSVSLVYGVPYNPVLSIEQRVFSFIATPEEELPSVEFSDWKCKSDRHTHVPTKAFSNAQYGRWYCQLFTTEELKNTVESQNTTFYVTRLRGLDDPWWGQVINANSFLAYLKTEIHDPELASNTQIERPTRPDAKMLLDIPIILSGKKGLAPPSEDDEEVPEACHLEVVGCPPFGYWASLLRNHVWQRTTQVLHRSPAYLLKPQWLLDFLPPPGMLGPLFVPASRQVQQQLKSSMYLRKTKEFAALPEELSSEQYKRIKTHVINNITNVDKSVQKEKNYTHDAFASSTKLLRSQGRLNDPKEEVAEEESFSDNETAIWEDEAISSPPSVPRHVEQPMESIPEIKRLSAAWNSVKPDKCDLHITRPIRSPRRSSALTREGPWKLQTEHGQLFGGSVKPGVEN